MSIKITPEESRQFIHIKHEYIAIELIGEGTFSTVYKAIDIAHSEYENTAYVALKNITRTTAPNRVCEELRILKILAGKHCTVPLLKVKRFEDQIIAIFPYFAYTEFRTFLEVCTLNDIKHYMFDLITSLKWVHKNNIIHRDIKPSNFLYDINSKKGLLIDFGLAQIEQTKKQRNESRKGLVFNTAITKVSLPPGFYQNDTRKAMKADRAGTRGFRAPEVLFKVPEQTIKIDMWSTGVILLILLTKQYPFFFSLDDIDALVEIGTIFGHAEMKVAARFYGRIWKSNIPTIPNERISFETIIKKLNPEMADAIEAIDLLYVLMEVKDERRLNAEAALDHPFLMREG